MQGGEKGWVQGEGERWVQRGRKVGAGRGRGGCRDGESGGCRRRGLCRENSQFTSAKGRALGEGASGRSWEKVFNKDLSFNGEVCSFLMRLLEVNINKMLTVVGIMVIFVFF